MTRETIGRYEIQSEIGRGGMATVYLAYDPSFRRNVAIKLVSINLHENGIFRERFEREAQTIARIEHPAIVPVYDFGEQDNQLYLVMRYMPGGALTDKIREGALTLRQASLIISHIAPALDAVHAQGVVHRDLKPANILLDAFGNAALSDFGIAFLTAATADLTGSAIIGTPSYMSPEQVRGDGNLDGRSDIYALGVILFEMLTGSGPFRAATPLSLAMQHLTEPVPSIHTFRPDLPDEVRAILSRALAKDREMRYASVSEFARELSELSNTFQESLPPPVVVKNSGSGEMSTEIDASEDSQSGGNSSGPGQRAAAPPSLPASRRMTRPRRSASLPIAGVTGIMLLLVALCGSVGLFGVWAGLGLPGFSREQSPTAAPSATASHTETPQPGILFADDFSDPLSGWPTIQNALGGYRYEPDGYHIYVSGTDSVVWAKTNRQDDNISISVDARPVTEGANGYYGLLCRIQDDRNFYYFVIRNDGQYTMGKYRNAEFQPFLPDGWRRSDAIHQGHQSNLIEVTCAGDTLRLSVNRTILDEAKDSEFISGFSGLVAASLGSEVFEVLFNHFLITEAGQ